MYKAGRLVAVGAFCSLGVLISVACSAQTKGATGPGGQEAVAKRVVLIEDCMSLGEWSAREACFAGVDKASIESCEASQPLTCRPFQEMHEASERLRELEAEIERTAAITYSNYVENDPAYVEDLLQALNESGASWSVYRDAQCQLEPLVSGMSRRDLHGMVEQCRLDRTRLRTQEMEGLLRVLKSNKER